MEKETLPELNFYEWLYYISNASYTPHYKELQEWSENSVSAELCAAEFTKQIENEKYQIREILNSKCFKIGRIFTKKENRLDMNEYKEYSK